MHWRQAGDRTAIRFRHGRDVKREYLSWKPASLRGTSRYQKEGGHLVESHRGESACERQRGRGHWHSISWGGRRAVAEVVEEKERSSVAWRRRCGGGGKPGVREEKWRYVGKTEKVRDKLRPG